MSHLDLNLMSVFDTIMVERNLRRTAERLGRSQPAVSQAVGRLRDMFGDQLFIRTPQGVQPTSRAEALWEEIRGPLAAIRFQIAPDSFEPSTASGEIRIGLSEDLQAIVLADIVSEFRRNAPGLILRVVDTDHTGFWSNVRSGHTDVGISVAPLAPKGLADSVIHSHSFALLYRQDTQPPSTLAAYLAATHVAVGFKDGDLGFIDRQLEQQGTSRHVIAWTPRFLSIPDLVARTGAIATMPLPFAKFCAEAPGVSIGRLPFAAPDISVRIGWHMRRQSHPLHKWVREHAKNVVERKLVKLA